MIDINVTRQKQRRNMNNNKPDDNLRIVRRLSEAFEKRDIETIKTLLSKEVEWGEPSNPYNPAGGTRHGHAGFMEWINIGRHSEEILTLELKKFLVDDDSIAVAGFTKCLAKPTGKTYETDFVHMFTLNDRKIVKFQEFFDTYIAGEAFR